MPSSMFTRTIVLTSLCLAVLPCTGRTSERGWDMVGRDTVEDIIGHDRTLPPAPETGVTPADPAFPPPLMTNELDILLVIMKNIDVDYEDAQGNPQHETSSMFGADIAMIEFQFQKFLDTLSHHSGGWLELNGDVVLIEEPITEISGNGSSGYHVGPGDMVWAYEDHIEFGQYDHVMLYWKPLSIPTGGIWGLAWWFYQGSTPEGEAWGAEIQPIEGAAYINCFYYPSLGYLHYEMNLHEWLHHLNALMYYKAGFPDEMVPDAHWEDDPDWDPQGHTAMDYYIHILEDHMTPLLYLSADVIDRSGAPYIRDWLSLGPFDNEGDSALEVDYIGEESILPRPGMESGGLTWEPISSDSDYVDLRDLLDAPDVTMGYAHTYFHSPRVRPARIWTGSNDGIRVWLNGNLVRDTHVHRKTRADAEAKTVLIPKGWSRLLVKVEDVAGWDWGFFCRLFSPEGGVFDDLVFRLDPPPPHDAGEAELR